MMIGLKAVAEGRSRHRVANHAHVALWMAAFVLIVATAVLVVRRRDWIASAGAFVSSAILFQVLTLGQPPLALGVALLVLVSASFGALVRPEEPRLSMQAPRPPARV